MVVKCTLGLRATGKRPRRVTHGLSPWLVLILPLYLPLSLLACPLSNSPAPPRVQNLSELCQDPPTSMSTSSSMGQLVSSRRGGEQHDTIEEEDGVATSTEGEEETREAGGDDGGSSTHGHRRDNAARGIHLMNLHIDKVQETAFAVIGQVSPASERARRPSASGSVSPGRLVDNRYAMIRLLDARYFLYAQGGYFRTLILLRTNTRTCE